jgi:peptidoglycan/LPS O-acetylase OafA/YrhL
VILKNGALFHVLTYTVNYQRSPSWEIGHIWSLSVEEHFYLVWPLALVLIGLRKAGWFACSLLVISPLCRYILYVQGHAGQVYQTQAVADSLATGACLAMFRGRLHAWPRYCWLLSSPLASLAPVFALTANLCPHGPIRALLITSIINLAIVLTLDRYTTFPDSPVGRLLNTPFVAFVGVISYSLYLWQQPFLNRAQIAWHTVFPQNLILTVLAALASYYFVEKPFLRLRKVLEDRGASSIAHLPRSPEPERQATATQTSLRSQPTFWR